MQTIKASYRSSTIQSLISRVDLQISESPLPCRGCSQNCPDYGQCLGKPWRLAAALSGNRIAKSARQHQ